MPQPEPSVSDSISYLQNFLNTSGSVLDDRNRDNNKSSNIATTTIPPRPPPPSLPASFLQAGASSTFNTVTGAAASTFPRRRSPPSTISVLSHRSSAQRSALDDVASDAAFFAPSQSGRGSASLLNASANRVGASTRADERFSNQRGTQVFGASASLRNESDMFRYGIDVRRSGGGDGWRSSTTPSPSRPLGTWGLNSRSEATAGTSQGASWQRGSPSWGQGQASLQAQQRHSVSSSPSSYSGSPALRAEERFPWRHSAAAAAPTHHGASLLWGWGDERSGATAQPTGLPSSPSPLQPSAYTREDPRRSSSNDNDYDYEKRRGVQQSSVEANAAPAAATAAQRSRRSRVAAYEEVGEDTVRKAPSVQRRRPPLPPPATTPPTTPPPQTSAAPPRTAGAVELSVRHNPDEHAANMRRMAHYLKDYYAREADEMERGVESLTAEDVAGLAQCFYIDLYRIVRQARRSAGLETSSFVAEDPTDNVIAAVAPPAPLQREVRRYERRASPHHTANAAASSSSAAEDEESSVASTESEDVSNPVNSKRGGRRRLNSPTPPSSHHQEQQQGVQRSPSARTGSHLNSPDSRSNGGFEPSGLSPNRQLPPPRPYSSTLNPLLSSPEDELLSSPAAATRLAPNEQLAYSGGGSHPVQVITARVPAFRNDDTVMADNHSRTSSFSQQQQQQHQQSSTVGRSASSAATSASRSFHQTGPSFTYHSSGDRRTGLPDARAAEAASLSALATTPSPPYRHLVPAAQQQHPFATTATLPPWTASAATSPYTSTLHPADASYRSHPSGVVRNATDSPRHRSRHQRSPRRREGQRVVHVRDPPHGKSRNNSRLSHSSSSSNSDNGSFAGDGEDATEDDERTSSYTAEGSERGDTARHRRPAPAEPSSGIVKRPLKDLMPLLRSQATLLLKQVHHDRRPHLRLFQVLDCIDVYQGKEVLMPHFTWVAGEDLYRHDRRPRPKKTHRGVPLPTGLSLAQHEVPYETALNLTHLEAVYVGAGRGISEDYMGLFHRRRRDGAVLDHRRRPVANGMCAVFVFAERPVAVTFLREDDRQLWVGAMMGVVERNRSLSS